MSIFQIENGTRVHIRKVSESMLPRALFEGRVIDVETRDGIMKHLAYKVEHDDGTTCWYDEKVVVPAKHVIETLLTEAVRQMDDGETYVAPGGVGGRNITYTFRMDRHALSVLNEEG
jgi:hypothetical protein